MIPEIPQHLALCLKMALVGPVIVKEAWIHMMSSWDDVMLHDFSSLVYFGNIFVVCLAQRSFL